MLNGDAIFDDNLKKIYHNHEKKNYGITFLGCSTKLNLGIVGKINNKIVSFDRDIDFYSIKKKKYNTFLNINILMLKSRTFYIYFKKLS